MFCESDVSSSDEGSSISGGSPWRRSLISRPSGRIPLPHHRLCSHHGWHTIWRPLLLFLLWRVSMYLVLSVDNSYAPPLTTTIFAAGFALAYVSAKPGRHIWLFALPSGWISWSFPGSYYWCWAVLAPLPHQTGLRQCSPTEVFGRFASASFDPPRPSFNSPYRRGECVDPVCSFVLRAPEHGWQKARRPVFSTPEVNVSSVENLVDPCRITIETDAMKGPDHEACSQYCTTLLGQDQKWRFVVHFVIPFCSGLAGWEVRGGGAVYIACGQSALFSMPGPFVIYCIAALYSMPLFVAMASKLRVLRRWRTDTSGNAASSILGPSHNVCLPDGRFQGGKMYFPYMFVSVANDAQGERFSFFLEALWVVPDVPMDLVTCLLYMGAGDVHRAALVLFSIVASGDPFQVKGARALASRLRRGYPSRSWWQYRAKEGYCESGLAVTMSLWTLATSSPHSAKGNLQHTMAFGLSAGTSLLAVSAGAGAHALLHMANHSQLDLRDYYAVMRVRKGLGMVRLAAMIRMLSSTWAAALSRVAGQPELVAINFLVVLAEGAARGWEDNCAHLRGLSRVTRTCRYICLLQSLITVVREAVWNREELLANFARLYAWDGFETSAVSLAKSAFLLLAGPMAALATPVADLMSHRAVSSSLALLREDVDPETEETDEGVEDTDSELDPGEEEGHAEGQACLEPHLETVESHI
mmetsp:Transcript_13523/g.28219  ORF Transcript_13523/g.28219 Transcript_13523/m.28219 type:complete len:698 (-) Transcript_13523:186-2279(-)